MSAVTPPSNRSSVYRYLLRRRIRRGAALAAAVDLELKRLLARAVAIVESEAHLVRRLADELLRRRVLVGDEIEQVLRNHARVAATADTTAPEPEAH